jgi:uncharacterized membrane-anchored protein
MEDIHTKYGVNECLYDVLVVISVVVTVAVMSRDGVVQVLIAFRKWKNCWAWMAARCICRDL